jgi:phosphoribulokinase
LALSPLAEHRGSYRDRPVMLAIAGESGAGKSTLAHGIAEALGAQRCLVICADDYHRYERGERSSLGVTPADPATNFIDIMEQHLQLLAMGQPILKPVYEHATGRLVRPQYVSPREFIIVEGLLPLSTKPARACFDVSVFLSPPDEVRREWKLSRDINERNYDESTALAQLERLAPDAVAYIRPQRKTADLVVSFGPVGERSDPAETPLSAELLLRPTIDHPSLYRFLSETDGAMHLRIVRDEDGAPVDRLHVHGHAEASVIRALEKAMWTDLATEDPLPSSFGALADGRRSEPLAVTQMILLYYLKNAAVRR